MDSGSQAAVYGGSVKSGGKIYKRRRVAAGKTPYDRPTPYLPSENPNWLKGLALPAKFVANGASKLFSSFWNPKSWASRSCSSSDSDSDSEGGIEDDENLSDGGAELKQNKGSSSGKSEILYLVEQLLMLDRYSREECDRLIKIINSRVEDYTIRKGVDTGPKNPDIHNQTIMEARKLITENLVGSSLKSDLDNSILMTPNKDYFSGGSWNIDDEIQRLRSKLMMKPKFLKTPKLDDEIVNLALEDVRITREDVPTEALSTLPTIEEQNQLVEEKEVEDEFTEVADVIASQGSSNTFEPVTTKEPDSPIAKRAGTRSRRNTKRGRVRAK